MTTVNALLEGELPSQSWIAHKTVECLTSYQLWLYLWQQKIQGREEEARQLIQRLLAKVWLNALNAPQLEDYQLPETRVTLTCHELAAVLVKTSVVRRRALLFAADVDMPLEDVVTLRWSEVNKVWHDLPELSRSVLNALPRSIQDPVIFWEPCRLGGVMPLIDLPLEPHRLGFTWEQFKQALDSGRRLEPSEATAAVSELTLAIST